MENLYETKGTVFTNMTNEEYREKLAKIFNNINENYKLKWFYNFIVAKLEG